jgi:hypothetical protein
MTPIDLSRLRAQTRLLSESSGRLSAAAWVNALSAELLHRRNLQEAAARALVVRLVEQDASLRAATVKANVARLGYVATLTAEEALRNEGDLVLAETTTAHSHVEEALRHGAQHHLDEMQVLRLLQQAQATGLRRPRTVSDGGALVEYGS